MAVMTVSPSAPGMGGIAGGTDTEENFLVLAGFQEFLGCPGVQAHVDGLLCT